MHQTESCAGSRAMPATAHPVRVTKADVAIPAIQPAYSPIAPHPHARPASRATYASLCPHALHYSLRAADLKPKPYTIVEHASLFIPFVFDATPPVAYRSPFTHTITGSLLAITRESFINGYSVSVAIRLFATPRPQPVNSKQQSNRSSLTNHVCSRRPALRFSQQRAHR